MAFTNEQLKKAKSARSVDELRKLAEENGVELSEELEKKYNSLRVEGEISDDELSNVSGGCGDPEKAYRTGICDNYKRRHADAYGGEFCKFYEGDPCCENCEYFEISETGSFIVPNYDGNGFCYY